MLKFLNKLRGRGLKNRILNPRDEFFDRKLGIKTFAYKKYSDDMQNPLWKGDYMPSRYKVIFSLLKEAKLDSNSVVIDYGCGLGRVVFSAAYLGAKRSVGIEFDDGLFKGANLNKNTSKLSKKTSFVHQDASSFEVPDDANIFFFFNPFGASIMSEVIKRIEKSVEKSPRKICIVYKNPKFQHTLASSTNFRLLKEWPETSKRYKTQFWTNQDLKLS